MSTQVQIPGTIRIYTDQGWTSLFPDMVGAVSDFCGGGRCRIILRGGTYHFDCQTSAIEIERQIRDALAAIEQAKAPAAKIIQRRYPCGCVTCICDDDKKCHGCGAKNCGKKWSDGCDWVGVVDVPPPAADDGHDWEPCPGLDGNSHFQCKNCYRIVEHAASLMEQGNCSGFRPPKPPAPDDAAAIEAALKALNDFQREYGCMTYSTLDANGYLRVCLAYHAKASERDAATIAELRRKLERQSVEIQDLKSHAREWEEQAQLASRPAPGEVPELTDDEVGAVWNDAMVERGFYKWSERDMDNRTGYARFANACIRAAFAKMPRREPFDVSAFVRETLKTKSFEMTTHAGLCVAIELALEAAGVEVTR